MKGDQLCTHCGYQGRPEFVSPSHFIVEILIWIVALGFAAAGFWLAIVGAIAFTLWRYFTGNAACPTCHHTGLIPPNSPVGQQFLERLKQTAKTTDQP